jgi:LmbE family N-acetylglucosaminyl deacetylase
MGGQNSDRVVDITGQFDRKVRALLCHESQHPNPDGMQERVRGWNEAVARDYELGDGRLAEVFQVVPTG